MRFNLFILTSTCLLTIGCTPGFKSNTTGTLESSSNVTPAPAPAPVPDPPPTPAPQTDKVGPIHPVGQIAGTPCTGVSLNAGADINAAVVANPAGTTFCLAAGTFTQQTISPKDGNTFIGDAGTILDGQNQAVHAFKNTANNVTIKNLMIQNYTAGEYDAAISTQWSTGWTIANCDIHHNAGSGLMISPEMTVQGNYLHHNEQAGFTHNFDPNYVLYTTNVIFDSNEVAFNNFNEKFNGGWEAGGGKFWNTDGLIVTHNYVHDNHGPGLWTDWNNINVTYAFNRVENNSMGGIFHEISYNASIHDNVLVGNARAAYCSGWLWCGEIGIAASGGVNGGTIEIYNNNITTADASQRGNGITLIQQERGAGRFGTFLVQNVNVYNNTIDLSRGGMMGAVQDMGDKSIFTSRNNKFVNNNYILGSNPGAFAWDDWNEGAPLWWWQGFGNDPYMGPPRPESAEATEIPSSEFIVDATGTVYRLHAGKTYRDGVYDGGSDVVRMVYHNHSVFIYNNSYGWFTVSGSGWVQTSSPL